MKLLPRRYLRLISYLVAIAIFWLLYQGIIKRHHYNVDQRKQHAEEKEWLNANDFEPWHASKNVIVNIGTKRCFHFTRLWNLCFVKTQISQEFGSPAIRKVIAKDLRGSYGQDWFGISEYIFYDSLRIGSIHTLDDAIEWKAITAVSSISNLKTPDAYELLDDVYVKKDTLSMQIEKQSTLLESFDILFGDDCVDPRPDWKLEKSWILYNGRFPSFLSYKRLDLVGKKVSPQHLQIKKNGKFKIVQLADLHFSVGESECRDEYPKHEHCEADAKTLEFITKVLEIEKPNLVVFTGDQIMGDKCIQDSQSALLKVLAPVIEREIPWALIWGNHDSEGSLDRWQLSQFTANLPYSMFSFSPKDTNDNSFGVGNYILQVEDELREQALITLFFFDSHSYSRSGKVYPGYDWIKESQWDYMKELYDEKYSKRISKDSHLSMAFFHIPIPEYLNFDSKKRPGEKNVMVGALKEGITAPKYNSGGKLALSYLGVDVTSCGHDHCNDYCLLDDSPSKDIWLCFGGGAGEGGYAGYGGTERRIRTYEFDTKEKSISTWKRLNGLPDDMFDYQLMVSDGVPNVE